MYKNGHRGLALFLSAPIVAVLILLELYALAILFSSAAFFMPSIPDIDIHLQEYLPISHRGITHTIWFALIVGVLFSLCGYGLSFLPKFALLSIVGVSLPVFIVFCWFIGFSVIMFHICGDIITPMGVNIRSRHNRGGYSLDYVLAKNKIANHTAVVFGLTSNVLTIAISQQLPLYFDNTLLLLPATITLLIAIYAVLFGLWLFISTHWIGRKMYHASCYAINFITQ